MVEVCQRDLNGLGMPFGSDLRIVVQIFMAKDDIRNCSCYRTVKRLELGMHVVEGVIKKMARRIVTVDEIQFGFMPERGTIDTVFIFRRVQEEYLAKRKKLYMWFFGLEKNVTENRVKCLIE